MTWRWLMAGVLLLARAGACGGQGAAMGTTAGEGVSRELAVSRAARVSGLRYGLEFQLKAGVDAVGGTETLRFEDGGAGDLWLDYRDGVVSAAVVNGTAVRTEQVDGHLRLPAAALRRGANEVKIAFTSQAGAAGKAITRYRDRDDGSEYVYTLFVPMDASMAFPCFDQPDLKGRFTLTVAHPGGWTVVGNGTPVLFEQTGASAATTFAETLPISTYLFAFAAGPWAKIDGRAGEPAVYVRRSQLARAVKEAPAVQAVTARGVAWLSGYFAQPFPFPKYELVLIPGFPFGGMEHAGATFLNEDGVLFRTAPTASDYFRRDTLLLHETCHQWFGDLVTMRWFDDLWLKEGFAQYMAYKALAALKPESQPWKHFYEDIKPVAYGIDETEGTTPIYQRIPNLKDAKSAYGAIVYQKAPSVLKQLNYFVGEENFEAGLRLYLKQHAYGNAQWADLVGALSATGSKDVKGWADAWILRRGMPEIEAAWTCAEGKLTGLTLTQKDVLQDGYVWPISNELLLAGAEGQKRIGLQWDTARVEVRDAVGNECPRYVFANAGDFGYGRFLLDGTSERYLAGGTESPPAEEVADGFLRTQLYGALWENVRTARSAPAGYVGVALRDLAVEQDESLSRIQGARVATALHRYMAKPPEEMRRWAYAVVRGRMLEGPTLGLRIVSFRTFVGLADAPAAWADLAALLDGKLSVPGLELRPLDRWNMVGQLIAAGSPEAERYFAQEKARDQTGEGQKYAYAVKAGDAALANKDYYFNDWFQNTTRQEDWITASLRPFNSWNQAEETVSFLKLALDKLPKIKRGRKIFFLGAWLGAFLDGQHSEQAQALVHGWLKESAQEKLDPDLRLKVLEAVDGLDRAVTIRKRWAE